MRIRVLTLLLAGLSLAAGPPKEKEKVGVKVWAGLSVNEPVFRSGESQVVIRIAVVNDGDRVLNPELTSSELLVNGKLLKNWDVTINNGPRDKRFNALPAGDYIALSFDVTEHFQTPGTYKLLWKGKHFRTPEFVFRVLPKQAQ